MFDNMAGGLPTGSERDINDLHVCPLCHIVGEFDHHRDDVPDKCDCGEDWLVYRLRAVLAGSEGERETRNEYLARKMGELADATRKAAKLLPDRPITGEVVACAGIMAMANLLDEVRAALAGSGEPQRDGIVGRGLVERARHLIGAAHKKTLPGYVNDRLSEAMKDLDAWLASAPPEASEEHDSTVPPGFASWDAYDAHFARPVPPVEPHEDVEALVAGFEHEVAMYEHGTGCGADLDAMRLELLAALRSRPVEPTRPTLADVDAFVAWLADTPEVDERPLAVLEWARRRFRGVPVEPEPVAHGWVPAQYIKPGTIAAIWVSPVKVYPDDIHVTLYASPVAPREEKP